MLIWIEGNLNPQELRDKMRSDSLFKGEMFAWLKSIIHCELPSEEGMTLKWGETPKMVVASSKESIWETRLSIDMAT